MGQCASVSAKKQFLIEPDDPFLYVEKQPVYNTFLSQVLTNIQPTSRISQVFEGLLQRDFFANLGTVHDEQQITTELDNEIVDLTMRKSLTGAPSLEVLNLTELEQLDSDNNSTINNGASSCNEQNKDIAEDTSSKEKPHVHITVYF